MTTDWSDGLPKMLGWITGPNDEPILTPVDRRWLWHLEAELCGASQVRLRETGRKLKAYLAETPHPPVDNRIGE